MEIGIPQIVGIIGAVASILCTIIISVIAFFIKKMFTDLNSADQRNAEQIEKIATQIAEQIGKLDQKNVSQLEKITKQISEQIVKVDEKNALQIAKVEEKLNDLKADLPLIYVTREDYIRIMNRVEDKLDQLLYSKGSKGKEE
jgi:transcriptional regulator NrdR family protein